MHYVQIKRKKNYKNFFFPGNTIYTFQTLMDWLIPPKHELYNLKASWACIHDAAI